jgi:hypothetical protein
MARDATATEQTSDNTRMLGIFIVVASDCMKGAVSKFPCALQDEKGVQVDRCKLQLQADFDVLFVVV